MLSNTDHLAESEAAKAREQDALRDLAEARLEIERLRKVISVIQGVLSNYDLKLSEIPDTAPVDVPVKELIAEAAEHWANIAPIRAYVSYAGTSRVFAQSAKTGKF